jgi:hypothetical protein
MGETGADLGEVATKCTVRALWTSNGIGWLRHETNWARELAVPPPFGFW